jgi:hypothetical protein
MSIVSHASWNETVITPIQNPFSHVCRLSYSYGCVDVYSAVTFINAPSCVGFKSLSELSFEAL